MRFAFPPAVTREVEKEYVATAAARGEPDAYMLRAAHSIVHAVNTHTPDKAEILVLVGGGDNGGDGLHAAALLAAEGRRVRVALLTDHPHPSGLAAVRAADLEITTLEAWTNAASTDTPTNMEQARYTDSHTGFLGQEDRRLLDTPVWVDAITGTGMKGPVREPLRSLIHALSDYARRTRPFVLAVDLPSGLWEPNGRVDGPVLPADHVVTMGAYKTPLILPPARMFSTRVDLADIGITFPQDERVGHITAPDVAVAHLVPGPSDHKYTRGVVCAAVGSRSYPGAGVLAVEGALSVGPGMVRLLADPRVESLVMGRRPAVVTVPGRFQAGVVGPGMDESARPRAEALAAQCVRKSLPLIVDAEALGLVDGLHRVHGELSTAILTPHAGEAAALLAAMSGNESVTRGSVEEAPVDTARELAHLSGAVVVLKGACTVVADPDGRVRVGPCGSPWTGVAGAGDVLAGILAALAAAARVRAENHATDSEKPAVDLLDVAARGVWIHAEAARRAAHEYGACGGPIQPEEIAAAVPAVIGSIVEKYR